MNPNVTYTSYGNPNHSLSQSNSHSHSQGHYRVNPSIHSTLNMDAISTTTNNNFANAGAYGGNNMNVGQNGGGDRGGGGGGGPLARSMTRNSYLSYASTPSWVNPSTMMETSTPARTPRPLPDPHAHNQGTGHGYGHGVGHGIPVHGSSVDSRPYVGYANPQPQHFQHGQGQEHGYVHDQGGQVEGQGYGPSGGRPHSGFYITNVTEEEEEEYVDHEAETAHGNGYPQYQNAFQGGYNATTPVPSGYSMPVGMGGMGVPMERVAPPPQRRPLPIPGATQSMRRNGTLGSRSESTTKKKSFVGGFFLGLKRLPKTVLRYGSKKGRKRLAMNEEYGVGETGLTAMHTGGTLPQYASNPATPTVGPYVKKSQTPPLVEEESGMPGGMPLSPPRLTHPSLRLTPPSGETLGEMNPEDQQYFQSPEQEDYRPPPVVGYPPPSTERHRTTVMMYHEEPPQETNTTTAPSSQPASENPPTVIRQPAPAAPTSRTTSNHTAQGLASDRERSTTPAAPNPIDTSVNPPQNVRSPETAHPLPANDYMKMTTSPAATGTQGTEVTEYTTFSSDPSFTTDLHPVFQFFQTFYHLPWISERSTVDYSPLAGFGGKSGGRGVMKKGGQSWYRKKGEGQGGLTSTSLDLLGGEGDTGSVLSPLGGWRRRVTRRGTGDHAGGRNRHHHRQQHHDQHGRGHHHVHGHRVPRGRRYRRRSTSTITFEEYHHQRNPSPMIPSAYPFPFVSPPFPYFQAFPATAAGGGSPAHADTSTTANQGTPGPAAPGTADGRPGENSKETQATAQSTGGQAARGSRGGRGGRTAMYPHGYAAYSPPPPVYPAPIWMAQGYGARGEGGGQPTPPPRHQGIVYMPVVPGAYV